MSIKSSSKDGIFNEINITPLTDIFLVLLIIMMVLAPMFQSLDKTISMPKINSGVSVENDKLTVSITKNSEFFVNNSPTDPAKLEEVLRSSLQQTKDKVLTVKADARTKNKEIMKVIRAAEYAGYEKLTIAGEPLSAQEQQDLLKKNKA